MKTITIDNFQGMLNYRKSNSVQGKGRGGLTASLQKLMRLWTANVDTGALQDLTVTSAAGESGNASISIAETKLIGCVYQYKHACYRPTPAGMQ